MNKVECSLAALIACFSWSGLYLDTAVAYVEKNSPPPAGRYWDYDRNKYGGPLGAVAIGYSIDLPAATIYFEGRHESFVTTSSDLGEETIRFGVKWRPFKR